MDKVVKREVIVEKYIECPRCHGYGEVMVRKFAVDSDGSEDIGNTPEVQGCPRCNREGKILISDTEIFWNSIDVKDLSPTQRKHFKAIMRKEVRSKCLR